MSRIPLTGIDPEPDITGLVKRAIDGDVESFGELYKLYLDRIYRYVYYQVKDAMMAEDITEDVFIKAWKAISSCRGKENTFSSWLYRIAHNQMVDSLRKNGKHFIPADVMLTPVHDYQEQAEKSLERQNILDSISLLPEQQKQVVLLKFIEGANNNEIGRIMGKKQPAVRILQMRALMALRQRLSKEADGNGT